VRLLPSLGFAASAFAPACKGIDTAAQVETIRAAMLGALGWPVPRGGEALVLRLRHAVGAERLWYLRSELMQALAYMHGELAATEQLGRISAMFHGVLPSSLVSSHRPL
jgi:hypothetical protein